MSNSPSLTIHSDVPLNEWLTAVVDALSEVAESLCLGSVELADVTTHAEGLTGSYIVLSGDYTSHSLSFRATPKSLVILAEKMLCAEESELSEADVYDAIGEISNMISGLAKSAMVKSVGRTDSGLPLFIDGGVRGHQFQEQLELEVRVGGQPVYLSMTKEALSEEVLGRRRALRELSNREREMRAILDTAPDAIITTAQNGNIRSFNLAAENMFRLGQKEAIGRKLTTLISNVGDDSGVGGIEVIEKSPGVGAPTVTTALRDDGTEFPIEFLVSCVEVDECEMRTIVVRDITDRKFLEAQLVQAQKLESIGQLAAGIAHEINTPTQYVGDNTSFLQESFEELVPLLMKADELSLAVSKGSESSELAHELQAALQDADIEFLSEQIPRAIERSLHGVSRVRKIVQSMKEFSHPGTEEVTNLDLSNALESTITVATNEWKYVADVETNFDSELPPVPCFPGELNQVILNLIVNAAHAISDVEPTGTRDKGTITISTRRDGEFAEIRIADTGTGIPKEAREKVFDPFFTTKEVGKGTGQGLSIAYATIVKKHGGTLDFETAMGKGTTFIIRLPFARQAAEDFGTVDCTSRGSS